MKKKILAFILIAATLLCLCACSKSGKNSYFRITFIDVGQGDAALVECDGHYMLIDGGSSKKGTMSGGYEYAGDKVYDLLKDKGIEKLDYLVISHLHEDHYGGLTKALTYVSKIKEATLSNSIYSDTKEFRKFEVQLGVIGTSITVPHVGDEPFDLGSAKVEVVDVGEGKNNDSLVLLITYENTRFLFTGDIETDAQQRTAQRLRDHHSNFDGVSLIKMPHHGAYNDYAQDVQDNALNSLFWAYDPSYFIISVGKNNQYKHPHKETLDIIEQIVVRVKGLDWNNHVFRTDENGDITVKSDGQEIFIPRD